MTQTAGLLVQDTDLVTCKFHIEVHFRDRYTAFDLIYGIFNSCHMKIWALGVNTPTAEDSGQGPGSGQAGTACPKGKGLWLVWGGGSSRTLAPAPPFTTSRTSGTTASWPSSPGRPRPLSPGSVIGGILMCFVYPTSLILIRDALLAKGEVAFNSQQELLEEGN